MNTRTAAPIRRLRAHDLRRLKRIASAATVAGLPGASLLRSKLLGAIRLTSDQVPSDVVSLNNWVVFRTSANGGILERRLLVEPDDLVGIEAHLSVLSPLGSALIGLPVGSKELYADGEGQSQSLIVEAIGPEKAVGKNGAAAALCTLMLLAAWLTLTLYYAR